MTVNVGLARVFALAGSSSNQTLRLALNVDNLFDRKYLNTGFTDYTAPGQPTGTPFIRGIYAAPRAVTGSVVYGF